MTKPYTPIRVIFADDHELLREGFISMMEKQPGIEIIGEAKNGQQLLQITRKLQPDIVITDIQMPVVSGIDATKEILSEFPNIGIIAYSGYNEEDLVLDMLKAGARGFILKNSEKKEVVQAVRAVHKGRSYYCKETEKILSIMRIDSMKNQKPQFSEKELLVIKLICEENSNQEIADKMGLSKRTVEDYRESIMDKTDSKNTAGVVLFAVRNKLFEYRKRPFNNTV